MKALILFLLPILIMNLMATEPPKKEKSFQEKMGNEIRSFGDRLVNTGRIIREDLNLKGGFGFTNRNIDAEVGTDDNVFAPGINTQFVYSPDRNWNIIVSSYIYFGKSEDLTFMIGDNQVTSQGQFRSVAFAPLLKYVSNIEVSDNWFLSFMIGPTWSIQTLKLKDFNDTQSNLRENHKLTYESRGAIIGIGVEEVLGKKELNPVYVEFIYSYTKAYKLSLVDASDFTEVDTIRSENRKLSIDGNVFMLNFGVLIF